MIKIVMGGQFGSEGKGAVTAMLASKAKYELVVRLATPNSGHTFYCKGMKHIMRQLSCTWSVLNAPMYLPSGSIISEDVLLEEVEQVRMQGYTAPIYISPYATLLDKAFVGDRSNESIGTTYQGVGASRAARCMRRAKTATSLKLPSRLRVYVDSAVPEGVLADSAQNVLVESSQGFGLSLHSSFYPYCTNIDVAPYQILQYIDAPFSVHSVDVWMVLRTFPIRVAGASGPLKGETTWSTVGVLPEFTSVTCRERRIGIFDSTQARDAVHRCRPDVIVLTFLDYVFPDVATTGLTGRVRAYVRDIERAIGYRIAFVGVGVGPEDIIEL